MNEQLQILFKESLQHYRARQLKKALNTAQIALEFGMNGGADDRGIIQTRLLLSRIYTTNGQYQNEPSFFTKALKNIEQSIQLNRRLKDQQIDIEVQRRLGEVHLYLKESGKAAHHLKRSLTVAQKAGDREGVIYALAALSQLSIAGNKAEEAIKWAEEALAHLAEYIKKNHRDLWAAVYLQLSQAYIKNQDYSRSLEISQQLIQLSRELGDIEKEIIALRNIAIVCSVKSNFKIGMQYLLEAINKCEAIGYQELYVQLQINIGTLYAHLYNFPEAVKRYEMALEENGELLENNSKLIVYNNLGNIYLTTHHPEKALTCFEHSYQLAMSEAEPDMEAHALAQLSRANLQLGQLPEAKTHSRLAQQLIDQIKPVNGRQINLLNCAEIAFLEGDFTKAHQFTDKAIQAAQEVKDDVCEIRCYKHKARIYKSEKAFEKALEYEEKYGKIQEAFAQEQFNRQFLDMEIRNAIKEKQKAIEALTRENDYQALLLQKSDQLASQNKELMQVNEDLKQFAYVASHDLKEPIRMIGSFTQIIHKKTKLLLEAEDHQYFEYIIEGVNRMNELLDGLLKYTTIGKHQLNMEEVDMIYVINVCLANLHVRIEETTADISFGQLPTVVSNKSLLIQLFQNLISNALKFSKKDQSPEIKIGHYTGENEQVFFVKDNGIGISPKNKKEIFDMFYRLHARNEYEGTGIGLAICQRIAKRLNGKLWVDSIPGEGSTFYFSMPV